MAKRTFPPVVNERRNQSKRNDVFAQIEEDLTYRVLYRDNVDGEPNHMENDLDMGGNALIVPEYVIETGGGAGSVPDFINLPDYNDRVTAIEAAMTLYSPITTLDQFSQSYLELWGGSTVETLLTLKPSADAPAAFPSNKYFYTDQGFASSDNAVPSIVDITNKPAAVPIIWLRSWDASSPSKTVDAQSTTIPGELVRDVSKYTVANQLLVLYNRHRSGERYDPAFPGHTVDNGVQIGDGHGPGYNPDGSADTDPYTLINGGSGYTAYSTVYGPNDRQTGWDVENEIRTVKSLNPVGTDAPTQGWTYSEASIPVTIGLKPRPPEPTDLASNVVPWPYNPTWFVDPNNVDEAFQYDQQEVHTSGEGTITFNCVIATDVSYLSDPYSARAGTEVLIPSKDPRWQDQAYWESEYAKEVARGKAPSGWVYGVDYPDDVTLNGIGSQIDPLKKDTRVYSQTKRIRPSFCSLVNGQVVANFPGYNVSEIP